MKRVLACAVLATTIAVCCGPRATIAPPPRERELRWIHELPLSDVGGDPSVIELDAAGGVWVAVPGLSEPTGAARVYHRPPGGAFREVFRTAYASELSLSSGRAGEVFFGFNQPYAQNRPALFRVSDAGATPLTVPLERIDEHEFLQVGGYAIFDDDTGWACGQRGRLWRRAGGAWHDVPSLLPWAPGDPENASYCQSLFMPTKDRGLLVDFDGLRGAWFDGTWKPLPPRPTLAFPPSAGVSVSREGVARFRDGAWRVVEGARVPRDAVFDRTGRVGVSAEGVIDLGDERTPPRALESELHFPPRGVAFAGEVIWVVGAEGIFRSTRERLPTFTAAPPGALPAKIAFSLAVDLDGDGHDDLVGLAPHGGEALGQATVSAWRSDGRGRFVPLSLEIPSKVTRWRDQLDAGDLDGDGDVDLALLSEGRVEVWRHEGDRFALFWSAAAPGATLALVDVDGDGDLDLSLVPGPDGVRLNDGTGRFERRREVPYPSRFGVERATWGDLDGDGRPDAILQHWRDRAHLLHQRGDRFELAPDLTPFSAEGATFEDVDGTGVPALLGQTLHVRDAALPFWRCELSTDAFRCRDAARTAIPSGLFVDLDLDGHRDVVVTDLRGDEHMTDEGEVWLWRAQGFERATYATGALPQPTPIDADGDGDLDVYSTSLGLRLNTADPSTWLRVLPRASTGDRLASGAMVLVRERRAGTIVATARADRGAATLGVPDRDARYDVEVRFPDGERARVDDVGTRTTLEVRDASGARWARRVVTHAARSTWRMVGLRELLPLGLVLGWLASRTGRRRLLGLSPLRLAAGVAILSPFALAVAVRAGGVASWLAIPLASTASLAVEALVSTLVRRRAARHVGPYLLVAKLGEGAAAAVWRARTGRSEVALKVFEPSAMSVAESRERFFREARVGGEITHDNVVKIRDAGQLPDGRCYLAMDLIEGRSLAAVLAGERLSFARAAAIARGIAEALAALHGAGVIHRDVKPENIMIRPDGRAVLTDLGLARSTLFRTMTRHDVAVGTLAYMSPEQCVGRPLDGASDQWSLGVTLYEMVTGVRPFVAEHELELVYVIHNVTPALPSTLAPGLPPALEAVIVRCLEREPGRRYPTARALAEALAAIPA